VVLPKSVTPSRIEENLKVVRLDTEDMELLEKIHKVKCTTRYVYPAFGVSQARCFRTLRLHLTDSSRSTSVFQTSVTVPCRLIQHWIGKVIYAEKSPHIVGFVTEGDALESSLSPVTILPQEPCGRRSYKSSTWYCLDCNVDWPYDPP
jgi:hypothetical protein